MPKITIDSEKIAEIRNALTLIQMKTETLQWRFPMTSERIIRQVKRIDKLLPKEQANRTKSCTKN